jgi:hypothetical protein
VHVIRRQASGRRKPMRPHPWTIIWPRPPLRHRRSTAHPRPVPMALARDPSPASSRGQRRFGAVTAAGDGCTSFGKFFIYIFYYDFAKIYDPPQILQNYTSAVVAHGVRDITSWPTVVGAASSGPLVWDRHSAARTPRR